MSHSKLESLPNEILIEIFEKYINGVDIINAFAFQLNHRFDHLILQCKRFRFDFVDCYKEHFQLCMGLLPAYIDRIEELALSDERTPGQVFAFLNFVPQFDLFKRLRRFYCRTDVSNYSSNRMRSALRSLSKINLANLTLEVIEDPDDQVGAEIQVNFPNTVATLCVPHFSFSRQSDIFPNLQCLYLIDKYYPIHILDFLLENAPSLRHLNMKLSDGYSYYRKVKEGDNSESRMTKLIIHGQVYRPIILVAISPYLRRMPHLRYLEVFYGDPSLDAQAMEILIKESLGSLTYFTWHRDVFRSRSSESNENMLAGFQTPFWVDRPHFQIICADLEDPTDRLSHHLSSNPSYLDFPLQHCSIVPARPNMKPQSPFRTLLIDRDCDPFLLDYHLNHLMKLVIHNLNDDVYQFVKSRLPTVQIQGISVSWIDGQTPNLLSAFLSLFPNLRSLDLEFEQLASTFDNNQIVLANVTELVLSAHEHPFDECHMTRIHTLCPNLQHLSIWPDKYDQLWTLGTHLPSLKSILIRGGRSLLSSHRGDPSEIRDCFHAFASKGGFYFRCARNAMRIWIDHNVFTPGSWNISAINRSRRYNFYDYD